MDFNRSAEGVNRLCDAQYKSEVPVYMLPPKHADSVLIYYSWMVYPTVTRSKCSTWLEWLEQHRMGQNKNHINDESAAQRHFDKICLSHFILFIKFIVTYGATLIWYNDTDHINQSIFLGYRLLHFTHYFSFCGILQFFMLTLQRKPHDTPTCVFLTLFYILF